MNRILTRQSFGIPADPWSRLNLATADTARAQPMIRAAVEDQAIVSILGPRGIGKTRALRTVMRGHTAAQQVDILRLHREKTHMGDIETAVATVLSRTGETLGRSGEIRTRRMRRILGEASSRGPVLLVIDDAHVLHHSTLRALKRLRELEWTGRCPLLGIVLLGQKDMLHGIDEIAMRADTLWMEGLTEAEATDALQRTVGLAFDPEAVDALAAGNAARGWLDLIDAADRALVHARNAGHDRVTLTDAVQATGAGLKTFAEAAGISQAAIARAVEKSESQVSRILSGERQDPAVQQRITDFLLEQTEQGVRQAAVGFGDSHPAA